MNTSNNDLKEFLLKKLEGVKVLLAGKQKIVFSAILLICVWVIVFVAIATSRKGTEEQVVATSETNQAQEESTVAVTAVALEENAYPEVNAFIEKYYHAMADGDLALLSTMNNYIDDTEKIRIEENSKYIEQYKNIDVYTKVGPLEGSYLAYVYSEIKFKDYETVVPGMQAYFLCTDEQGQIYVNDGEENGEVTSYIREVSLQDDVIDLNNKVAVAYNDMLAEDEELSAFLVDLTSTIGAAVGEALAKKEGTEIATPEEPEEEEEEPALVKVTKVKTTAVVNVRSSDSETADKLGKAQAGEEFKLVEQRGNGWSKIVYEDQEAFIKSDYLEASEEEIIEVVEELPEDQEQQADAETETETENEADAETETETAAETESNTETPKQVRVKQNVRIRDAASEEGKKLSTAYIGEKLEVIEQMSNGWTKIKYNGKEAYVKSDYVE